MDDSISYINSWKNKEVFKDQLALNEKELNNYPEHWNLFLNILSSLTEKKTYKILDLGCGVGTYKELCKRHLPNLSYVGMDYSAEAIEIAKKKWGGKNWIIGDYKTLTIQDSKKYDILHAGAMLDVLPNGDEALSFLLGLGFENIVLGRVKLTENDSDYTEYKVYNKIYTYAYSHNIHSFTQICKDAQYTPTFKGNINSCTILLRKAQLP